MVIAVDCDEVLVPTHQHFLRWLDIQGWKVDWSREKLIPTYDFSDYENHGLPNREAVMREFSRFTESNRYRSMPPVEGAQKAIGQFSRLGEVHIVTSRFKSLTDKTWEWVNTHFPGKISDIHFGNHEADGEQKSKLELCVNHRARVLIEDHPEYAEEVSDHIPVVLFPESDWNRDYTPENGNIYRSNSWKEVVEKVRDVY